MFKPNWIDKRGVRRYDITEKMYLDLNLDQWALSFERTKNFKYQSAEGRIEYRPGVVAMSISITDEGIIFHDCNIYHMVQADTNDVSATDYMTYNFGLENLFQTGIDGIMTHMRENMPHLVRRAPTASIAGASSVRGSADPEPDRLTEVIEGETTEVERETNIDESEPSSWTRVSMQSGCTQAERDAARTGMMSQTFSVITEP